MIDEVWSRGWSEAHKVALQARAASAREGRPMPSLWSELRMVVRDLMMPPVPQHTEDAPCDPVTCQPTVCQSSA